MSHKIDLEKYFYRFGRYAYIESPKELAEEMLNRYQSAARAYRRNIKGDNDDLYVSINLTGLKGGPANITKVYPHFRARVR